MCPVADAHIAYTVVGVAYLFPNARPQMMGVIYKGKITSFGAFIL